MCIIIYSPTGKIPRRHLRRGLDANPDGWGFAVATGTEVYVRRGMCRRGFWQAWRARPEGSVVWHARIASHGTVDIRNCHPFAVPGHGLVMAHNGTINLAERDDVLNDTQVFIRDVLAKLPQGFLGEPGICELIAGYIGRSKLVFLDRRGVVSIINEHLGHWHRGSWYSNGSYLPPDPPAPRSEVLERAAAMNPRYIEKVTAKPRASFDFDSCGVGETPVWLRTLRDGVGR